VARIFIIAADRIFVCQEKWSVKVLDVSKLLEEISEAPFEEMDVLSPHCGVLTFAELKEDDQVAGPSSDARQAKGTLLAAIERERNKRPIHAQQKARICQVHTELEGCFVEAGIPIMRLRHYLSRQEVLDAVLRKALVLFKAPERARYYFTLDIDKKIKTAGLNNVTVADGQDLFIMSRMKRETVLKYQGLEGNIYAAYFRSGETMDADMPLIGVCPPDQLPLIQDVVFRVENEWQEQA
jgi:hypothetical protein